MNEFTISQLGGAIRKYNLKISIDYGSGGFCVSAKHTLSNKTIHKYSWDLEDAIQLAIKSISGSKRKKAITDPGPRAKQKNTTKGLLK